MEDWNGIFYIRISSSKRTIAQQDTETWNKLAPNHADIIPTPKATAPAMGDWVA